MISDTKNEYLQFSFSPLKKKKSNHEDLHLTWLNREPNILNILKCPLIPFLSFNPGQIVKNNHKYTSALKGSNIQLDPNLNLELIPGKNDDSKSALYKNQIIHGDSLLGMAALITNGYQNKIQTIYYDPPFGINFNANFISKERKVQGYLDSWKNGLSSYLENLRNRLVLCRELLKDTGSIFLQIGETNLHYVRCILDETFGSENFVSLITFRTAISTNNIQNIADYLLWYAKDKEKMFRRQLYVDRMKENAKKTFTYSENNPKTGETINFKAQEIVKKINKTKNQKRNQNRIYPIKFSENAYFPPDGYEWRWDNAAMEELIQLNRIVNINHHLYAKRYPEDFPVMILTNLWTDTSTSTFAARKHYSVHTNPKVIRRCISMTSLPGDIVLDPTSGSGTTAIVAETLQRHWIVIDTSPTAILSTINWLLGSTYPIYLWDKMMNDFEYQSFNKISIAGLAKKIKGITEFLYDKPKVDRKRERLAQPFELNTIMCCVSDEISSKFSQILLQNGIFNADNSKFEYSYVKPHKIKEINNESINDSNNSLIASFEGKMGDKEHLILYANPQTNEMVQILISTISNILFLKEYQNFHIFLFLVNLQLDVISCLNSFQNSTPKGRFQFGYINPNLFISELNFTNNSDALILFDDPEFTLKSNQISFSSGDFNPLNTSLVFQNCANIIGIFSTSLKNKEKSVQILLQPFYKKFISKKLLESQTIQIKTLNDLQILLKTFPELVDPLLFYLDHFGHFHFMKTNF